MDVSGMGKVQSIQAALNAPAPVTPAQLPAPDPLLNPAVQEIARVRGTEKLRERQRGAPPSSLKVELDHEWTPDVEETPRHPGQDGQRRGDRPPHLDILA